MERLLATSLLRLPLLLQELLLLPQLLVAAAAHDAAIALAAAAADAGVTVVVVAGSTCNYSSRRCICSGSHLLKLKELVSLPRSRPSEKSRATSDVCEPLLGAVAPLLAVVVDLHCDI